MGGGDDPASIRSLAVSSEDVVNAFVYGRENPGTAVLRVTPPFHGRMRARLHVYHVDDTPEMGAIHVPPADLLDEGVVDTYPTLEAVEADLATDGSNPAPERVRGAHGDALESWRERALESIVDAVVLETADGKRRVTVKTLG